MIQPMSPGPCCYPSEIALPRSRVSYAVSLNLLRTLRRQYNSSHTNSNPHHRTRMAPSIPSHVMASFLKRAACARQYDRTIESFSTASTVQTRRCKNRSAHLVYVGYTSVDTSLARSRQSSPLQRAFSQNKPKLVAGIALEGQANKICGMSDHLNVSFFSKQALAELARVMFDQFVSLPDHPPIFVCYLICS